MKSYSEKEGKAWGHGEHANMPTEVKMESYSSNPNRNMPVIDDTDTRLMEDAKNNEKADRRGLERGMY